MGIPCLKRFVSQYFTGWITAPVNGKLIIDGYALFHALFEEFSTKQCKMYGGDYVSIRKELSKFFRTLVKAGINPIVVLDGTIDFDKVQTINDRANRRIEAIIDHLGNGDHNEAVPVPIVDGQPGHIDSRFALNSSHITPYLSTDVIVDSVKQIFGDDHLSSHLFVADCDADFDIACLAIHHQCPVLSNDSDFYIFPLLYGYIPYSRFHWRNAESNVIYGEFYSYQLFCEQFGIRDTSLLTIIPIIGGNDTVTRLDTEILSMIMPRDVHTGALIKSAVKYVTRFKTFDACLTSLRRQKLFDMIENIQHAYHVYFFLPLFRPRTSFATFAECRDGSPLPSFILEKYRKGTFLPFVIDVLWIHGACFNVAIEDILSEPWCCHIGVPIRKAIYSILCGSDISISECQRCDYEMSYHGVEIVSTTHVVYDGREISLPTLQYCGSEIDAEYGMQILFGILLSRKEDFKNVPRDYQLLLAITCYWYKHCTINQKEILLSSFILLVQIFKEHKVEKSLSGRTLPNSTQPPFPVASFAHAFAQWQSLYRDIQCLNELLQRPLKLLPVSDFLECSYLYSLIEAVMEGGVSTIIEQHCLDQDFVTATSHTES